MSGLTGAWRIWISETAREDMINAAGASHPLETGGVLVGVALGHSPAGGRPWVTNAVEVRSRKSGPGYYELPAGARQLTVMRMRRDDPRLGYLGDWHSHPADVDPSGTDAHSVASAAASGDLPHPILFVVRRVDDGYQIDARQWTGSALRRLQIRSCGPPFPPQSATRRPQATPGEIALAPSGRTQASNP
jgi:proteasome lid subunit RPN8/RPN11